MKLRSSRTVDQRTTCSVFTEGLYVVVVRFVISKSEEVACREDTRRKSRGEFGTVGVLDADLLQAEMLC